MTSPSGPVEPEVALKYTKRRVFSLIPARRRRALTNDEINTENEQVKLDLRRRIGWFALLLTGAQVVCADFVFILYAWLGMHWQVPTAAMQAWLAATVVEVIGIVLVITRSLFPENGGSLVTSGDATTGTGVTVAEVRPGASKD